MGYNLRWETLDDYTSREANIYAHCYLCNRTATFSSQDLAGYFRLRGWSMGINTVYQKLKCRRCQRSAGKVGPTRRLADTKLPPSA